MKETKFRKNGKMTAGQERQTHKKAEIKSFQERKTKENKRKQKEEYMMFDCGLQNIFQLKSGQSRSINWENRNGEKGKGGMASSDLGPSRKGSPCIPKIEAGETVTLGEIQEKASFSTSGSPSQTVPVNVTVMFCGILFCACTGMTKKIHPWNARLAISSAAASVFPTR